MATMRIDPKHIVKSPWRDIQIPDTDIYTFMFHREELGGHPPVRDPDRVVFIDGPSGINMTFRQLKLKCEILSRGLAKGLNIKVGDRICFFLPNHIDYPTALWAALRLGAVPSCANPIYTARELVHQLRLAKAQYILTHPNFLKTALEAADIAGIPHNKVFLISKSPNTSQFTTIPDLVEIGKTAPEIIRFRLQPWESKSKVALLNFSSGTSGLPKGVLISHYNVIANVCQLYKLEGFDPADTVCNGCLPFFHIYGLVVLLHLQVAAGRAVVIQPAFSPDGFVQDIHKYQITTLFVVPPILLALLHRIPHDKLKFQPALRSICCAAAPLPKDLVPHLKKIWPNTLIRQGWGMTETSTAVTIMPVGSPDGFHHTCGPIVPNSELLIVDTDLGRSVEPGHGQGELWVRAPTVTLGYIDNEKETREMFNQNGEGWMKSGDEAEFEKGLTMIDGNIQEEWLLCIRDRLKELIKVSGNQVAPAELENIIATHPAVADQAVVGKPDDRRGEVPWAFVVKKKDVSKEEIMEHVKARTNKYKHLGGVEFVEAIHKNPSGKILKRVYRDQFKKEQAAKEAKVKAKL